jgi:N12 class adenine-specific DNA methylase
MKGDNGNDPLTPTTSQTWWAKRNPVSAGKLREIVDRQAGANGYKGEKYLHGTPGRNQAVADDSRKQDVADMMRTYEGTAPGDFDVFEDSMTKDGMGLHFFTKSRVWASFFTEMEKTNYKAPGGYRLIPAYLKVSNAWDVNNPEHKAMILDLVPEDSRDSLSGQYGWMSVETPAVIDRIKSLGFDAVKLKERDPNGWLDDFQTIAVFSSSQAKDASLATFDERGNLIAPEDRFNPSEPSILRSSPSPQLDLFGGIEAQLTGPRAKVKAAALDQMRKAPPKAQASIAKQIAQREGLADLELFADGAVKALDKKPKRGESAVDELDLFSTPRSAGNRQPDGSATGQSGSARSVRGMAGEPDLFTFGGGGTASGQRAGSGSGGSGGGRGVSGNTTAGDAERGDAGGTDSTGARGDRRGLDGRAAGPDAGLIDVGAADAPGIIPLPENEEDRNARIDPTVSLVPKGQGAKIAANFRVIELLRQLTEEGRNPTTEEKARLLSYSGWGHSKGAFDDAKAKAFESQSGGPEADNYLNRLWKQDKASFKRSFSSRPSDRNGNESPSLYELYAWNDKWGETHRELHERLSDKEYNAAKRSVLNAHYTTPAIIDAQWQMVEKLGFKGGRALEPGGGIGHYIGTQPQHLAERTIWSAVELDQVTSQILALLYPQARVNSVSPAPGREVVGQGFEDALIADNSQDVVISNVPFHETGPWQSEKQFKKKLNLHNYFFARALQKAKPGGFVVFITSSSTMENNADQRRFLAERGELISAVRLPNNAFQENAGTQVTTDIIILRKPDGRKVESHAWLGTRVVGSDTVNLKRGDQTPTQWLKSFDLQGTWQNETLEAARKAWDDLRQAGLKIPTGKEFKAEQKNNAAATAAAWKSYVSAFETAEGNSIGLKLGAVLPIRVNEYFAANPQNAFGRHTLAGSMYSADEYALEEDLEGGTLEERFAKVIEALPSDIMGQASTVKLNTMQDVERSDKPFSFIERDGKFWQAQKDHLEPVEWSNGQIVTFRSWNRVKTAIRNLIAAELDPKADADEVKSLRETLNVAYNKHVGQFGPISKTGAGQKHGHLVEDPDFPLTVALEEPVKYTDRKGKSATRYDKADIFRVRMNKPLTPPGTAENVSDALLASLVWMGYPHAGYMAKLLSRPEAEVRQELIESELVFDDPVSGNLVPRDSYLSGFVQGKLDEARQAAEDDPAYRRNVAALEKALPERKGLAQIGVALNSPWLPNEVITAFMESLGLTQAKAKYSVEANSWTVSGYGNSDEFSTDDVSTEDLVQHALAMTVPRVSSPEGTGKDRKMVFDPAATQIAKSKLEKLKMEFQRWAKTSDAEVGGVSVQELIVKSFNEKANGIKPPEFEGEHITLPGASDEVFRSGIRRAAIARMLDQGSGMIAHGVGFGKTYTLIALAMEMKRLGKANRPMIIVENATLSQFAASFRTAYPNARLLVADKSSFEGSKRRQFIARIATGDHDCIVMPHSSFNLIGNHPDVVNSYINEQVRELEAARALTDSSDARAVAALEKAKIGLENSRKKILDALASRQDIGLTWEDLGIDALLVDEAHRYKNAPVITRMQGMKNLPTGEPSQRAIGMVIKAKGIQDKMGGRGIFFATGTPVSNSMAEAYVMLRYTSPHLLKHAGIENFDQFVASFGTAETKAEANWKGAISMETRLSKFVNGSALINLVRSSWDVQMDPDVAGIKRPTIKGGAAEQVLVAPGPANQAYNDWVVNTIAVQWEDPSFWESMGGKKEAFENNPWMTAIPIMTMQAGIAAALDVRLIDPNAPDFENSKVNTAVRNIIESYKATQGYLGAQAVFADLRESFSVDHLLNFAGDPGLSGQGMEIPEVEAVAVDADGNPLDAQPGRAKPKKAKPFDLYQDIARKLVAAGIPRSEIGLITSSMSPEKRTELFDKVNSGEIRVIVGSTDLMGVGVNMQERLYAMHHLMPPRDFKPASMEQRTGRILRQGNLHYDMALEAFVASAEESTGQKFRKEKGGRQVPDMKAAAAALEGNEQALSKAEAAAEKFHIRELQYAMEKSIDSAVFSMMASKQRMVVQLLMGEVSDSFEDPSDAISMGMAEIAARAIGDPTLIRRVELDREIRNLNMEFQGFQNELMTARNDLMWTKRQIKASEENLAQAQAFADSVGAIGTNQERETVWEFGGMTVDRNRPEDAEKGWKAPKLIEALDLYLAGESQKLANSDRKKADVPLVVDGVRFNIEIHHSLGDTRTEQEKYADQMAGKASSRSAVGVVSWAEGKNKSSEAFSDFSGAQSLIASITGMAKQARQAPAKVGTNIDYYHFTLPKLEAKAARTFERADELAALYAEMFQVEARLAANTNPQTRRAAATVETLVRAETPDNYPGRGLAPQALMSSPAAAPFYSQLAKTIEAKMPNSAPVAQVIQIAASGSKAEEMKWSGIEQAAQALAVDGKVSKSALLEHLRNEGAVRFEEVKLGASAIEDLNKELQPHGFVVDEEYGEFTIMDNEGETYEMEEIPYFAVVEILERFSRGRAEGAGTKYKNYTLPGGENYREVVLAMPSRRKQSGPTVFIFGTEQDRDEFVQELAASEYADNNWSNLGDYSVELKDTGDNVINALGSLAIPYGVDIRKHSETGTPQGEYTSSHFPDVPNYVAHMRVNERDGGLFIEEIQSDRHQAARKSGYRGDPSKLWAIYNTDGVQLGNGHGNTAEEGLANWKRIAGSVAPQGVEARPEANWESGIADAPFRKDWPLQMFKRALRDAVASGKDWIGWTVGETQIDRFDLSKQVDSVSVTEWPAAGPNMVLLTATKDGEQVIQETIPEAKIEDYVGKDLARKLMEQPSTFGSRELSGDGLKVGGSGMKGFYDDMLPKEIGKYVKQWGGKVERSTTTNPNGPARLFDTQEAATDWAEKNLGDNAYLIYPKSGRFEIYDEFDKVFVKAAKQTPIWRVNITPAMKAGVSQGQALFSSPTRVDSGPQMGTNRENAKIPSDEQLKKWIRGEARKNLVGKSRDLPDGTLVGLRIDINSFEDSKKVGDTTYVVTVHERRKNKNGELQVGTVIGYDGIARVKNPTFHINQPQAKRIHDGEISKKPIATVEGEFDRSREIPADIESWTPVGFNPRDENGEKGHSYMYLKSDRDVPVISGKESISVGNTVFVKDPVFGNPKDFLFSSPAPNPDSSAAVQQALEKMPPIYRKVFEAVNDGQSVEQVMGKFRISEKAVTNILNQVRSRITAATTAAGPGLQPAMKGRKIDGGRPDLALSTNPQVAAVDQIRNQSGVPDVRADQEVFAAAEKMLSEDYQGTYDMLLEKVRNLDSLTDVETAAAMKIIARETLTGKIRTAAERTKVGMLIHGYRDVGTEEARAFRMRRDPHKTPAERHARFVAEALFTPDPATRARLRKAPRGGQEAILAGWMSRVDGIKAGLLAQGLDLDASLAAFNAAQESRQEAEADSAQATAVIEATIRKLTKREKAVIEAIRSGALVSKAAFLTGLSNDEVRAIYSRFLLDIRAAMAESAKRFLAGSLAASPTDMMGQILAELGLPSLDLIDDTQPGFVDRRGEKQRTPRKRKPAAPKEEAEEIEAPEIPGLTPEQQAALDAAWERFKAAPPATWETFWQEEMKTLGPMVGQKSFEQFKGAALKPWTDLWQAEMEGIATPAARLSFDEWIAKPENADRFSAAPEMFSEQESSGMTPAQIAELDAAWERFKAMPPNRRRTFGQNEMPGLGWTDAQKAAFEAKMQGEISDWSQMRDLLEAREGINGTTGTFDLNDPAAMMEVLTAFSTARATPGDALMEFWKMSILSGPQTHIVNVSSNTLFSAYNLLPRRAVEAGANTMLSLVGLGSQESATFGEFSVMARHLKKAAALAARLGLASWKAETRTFEAYATAEPLQLDFTGVGGERFAPALGGPLGKVMRSISFRAMTAADEFGKAFFAQLEAAAQAHRIARVEEKLRGPAYEARLAELLEPGSIAWVRAIDEAKRITFQSEIDGSGPQLIRRVDQVAELAKKARALPYLGKPITFFLPFIDTPTNIAKQAAIMSPLGIFLSVVDGTRALKRKLMRGDLSKAEADAEAAELYNRARFVQDVTNQSIALMVWFLVDSLTEGDDDDELPIITGSMEYRSSKQGERENAYAVMPPQSIRLGSTVLSYRRFEPFATVITALADLSRESRRAGGMFKPGVGSQWLSSLKDQMAEKTFLQGVGNLVDALENPDRFATKLTANIATGFVPNLIRQPIRTTDEFMRDAKARPDQGFFESLARAVGYSLVPSAAPVRMDVWGNPVKKNRGETIGNRATDGLIRILDPTNVTVSPEIDPIDSWIYRYNLATKDSKERIGIRPISNQITFSVPGEKQRRTIPLSAAEQQEANRRAGSAARDLLGGGWDKAELSNENAARITEVVQQAQSIERARLKMEKIAAGLPAPE